MNDDSRDFQDAESVRSGHSYVTSQPVSFPHHPVPGGMLSRSIGMPSRKDGPPSILDTHGLSGHVFLQVQLCLLRHVIRRNWIHRVQNGFTHQRRGRMRIKHQFRIRDASPDRQPKIQSIIPSEGDSSKNYGADQQRLQISDLHVDKFSTATFACCKKRFKTEICTCSQFPTAAMLWIKEVEMVDSVDDLKSSLSVRRIRMPDFEVLDARIASALNRIIHNSHLKKKGQSGGTKSPKRVPFPSWKTDRLPDLRVLPGHWSQWIRRELCRPIYYCSWKWWYSGIRFEMGRNSIVYDENPIWWHLGRIAQIENTRVWET